MNAKLKGDLQETVRIHHVRGVGGPSRPTLDAVFRESQNSEGLFCSGRLNHAYSAQMRRTNDEAVWLPLRQEDAFPCLNVQDLVADVHLQVALDHVKHFILMFVPMRRRLVSRL